MRRTTIGLYASATVVGFVLVLILALQNRSLKSDLHQMTDESRQPHVGLWLPSVALSSLDGQKLHIGMPKRVGGYQILYFFSPSCTHCARSMPALNRIARRIRAVDSGVELIGITNAPDAETEVFIRKHNVDFPITRLPDARATHLFRVVAWPLVYVVDAAGQARYAAIGAIESDSDVNRILASLPKGAIQTN